MILEQIIKVCKKHGNLTVEQLDTGIYKGKKYYKCKKCEKQRKKLYWEKKYQDSEYMNKKKKRDNARWKLKKNEITEKRKTSEARHKRKIFYQENIEKYRGLYKVKQKHYRENLHDSYVRRIIQDGEKSIKFKMITPEMINLKRAIILLRRGIKNEIKNKIGGKLDGNKKRRTA